MPDGQHDTYPVLPGEARSLSVHVEQCALRYQALVRFHYVLSRQLRWMRLEAWVYRTATVGLLAVIGWHLQKLADKLPWTP